MKMLAIEKIKKIQSYKNEVCISLYMPTHRNFSDKPQDAIQFKNLIKELEETLSVKYPAKEVSLLKEHFDKLSGNTEFWNNTLDGLALFCSFDFFKYIYIPVPVKESITISDKFNTKVLRNYISSTERFYVLALNLNDVKVLEGNRYRLFEVLLPVDFPKNLADTLGHELTQKSSNSSAISGSGGNAASIHQGSGGKKDELDKDNERFFRIVADAVYESFSKPSGAPLVLAALPEHHNLFQKVSKNPFLLKEGITVNPASLTLEKMLKLAWEVVEPNYLNNMTKITERFSAANANGSGSDDLDTISKAAAAGRIELLIIEDGKNIENNHITDKKTSDFNTKYTMMNDILEDISELVTNQSGSVVVLPKDKMPTQNGYAAIFRY